MIKTKKIRKDNKFHNRRKVLATRLTRTVMCCGFNCLAVS